MTNTRLPQGYEEDDPPAPDISDRSRGVALGLGVVLGWIGAHRFYVGKIGSGILMAVTIGGLGIWYLYDLILIATGEFRDEGGRRLVRWETGYGSGAGGGGSADVRALAEAVESLRTEVSDLAERLDFTERLLAQQRERDRLPRGS